MSEVLTVQKLLKLLQQRIQRRIITVYLIVFFHVNIQFYIKRDVSSKNNEIIKNTLGYIFYFVLMLFKLCFDLASSLIYISKL